MGAVVKQRQSRQVGFTVAQRHPVDPQDVTVALHACGNDRVSGSAANEFGGSGQQAARAGTAGGVKHHLVVADQRCRFPQVDQRTLWDVDPDNVEVDSSQALPHGSGFGPTDIFGASEMSHDVAGSEALAVDEREVAYAGSEQQIDGE
jgi:hypothetical protein